MLALSTYQTWQNLFSMTHSLSCSAFALHCKSRIALEPQEGHTHSVLLQNPTAHCFSFRFMLLFLGFSCLPLLIVFLFGLCFFFLGFSCLPSSIHSASRTNIVVQNGAILFSIYSVARGSLSYQFWREESHCSTKFFPSERPPSARAPAPRNLPSRLSGCSGRPWR